jgi:hypothetical protein
MEDESGRGREDGSSDSLSFSHTTLTSHPHSTTINTTFSTLPPLSHHYVEIIFYDLCGGERHWCDEAAHLDSF